MELRRGLLVVIVLMMVAKSAEGRLSANFYQSTCPNLSSIVRQAVSTKISQTQVAAPATLRLFFHDCFSSDSCDASILISSPNGDAKKDAPDNQSLAGDGFDTVIKAKQAVEAQCPGVVSCADILAMAARDAVFLSGGPDFTVELGRRDGLVSLASAVITGNLPSPDADLSALTARFAKNGLSMVDMVALSGAHTIGAAHCSRFADRLFPAVAPSLSAGYAQQLLQTCPQNVDPNLVVFNDPVTPTVFDNVYYQNLANGMGLFTSDEVLFTDPASQPTVNAFAANPGSFAVAFVAAMVKLGRVGVLTGNQGEIRTDCTAFNS